MIRKKSMTYRLAQTYEYAIKNMHGKFRIESKKKRTQHTKCFISYFYLFAVSTCAYSFRKDAGLDKSHSAPVLTGQFHLP